MDQSAESQFRTQAAADGVTHLSTGVAVVREGKLLIVRRAAADYLGGQYELPGGGVDDGETLAAAASREVQEETGLTVRRVITTFDGFDYTTDRKPHVRQINFLVQVSDGDIRLDPNEHDAYLWVDHNTDLTGLMSDDMQACVTRALDLIASMRLYLLTLEVDPLIVGETYNPLPSHLTLVSRFWIAKTPEEITAAIQPLFAGRRPVELIFGEPAVIGPKHTAVHLIENTPALHGLHLQLVSALKGLGASFTEPQFIGDGHKPHVSIREGMTFAAGHSQVAAHAYLIEVTIIGGEHRRTIQTAFNISNSSKK